MENKQIIIWDVPNDDMGRLGKFYVDFESHIRILSTLGNSIKNYASLKSTIILRNLPPKID